MRSLMKRTFLVGLAAGLIALGMPLAWVLAQDGDVLTAPPQTFGLTQGWYMGRETFYYDFGTNTQATEDGEGVVPAPIYVLIRGMQDGQPQPVEGQANIIDVLPGQEGYSDLWQVTFVTVPADYEANAIQSAQAIQEAGYQMTPTDTYVNCPVVPEGSTLTEGGAPLVQGWYQGQEVYYFDFGQNPPMTAPIYALITGFDAQNNPQFVEGQNNIIGVVPGDEGYSAFWNVNLVQVPQDYEANTLQSVEAVMEAGYEIVEPGLLVNCPVLRTAAAQATPAAQMTPTMAATETPAGLQTPGAPTPGAMPGTGAYQPAPSLSLGQMVAYIAGALVVALGVGLVARAAVVRGRRE